MTLGSQHASWPSLAHMFRPSFLHRQIVERRLLSFEYIKSVCSGDCHWLSLVQLDLSDDGKQDETPQALRWYHLGVSIAPLLQLPSGPSFVRAVLQLFEELTYHFSSTARCACLGGRADWGGGGYNPHASFSFETT